MILGMYVGVCEGYAPKAVQGGAAGGGLEAKFRRGSF